MKIVSVIKKSDVFKKAIDIFKEEIFTKPKVSVAFSGGKTPKDFFKKLVKEDIDWSKVNIFLVDERFVQHSDKDSNYGLLEKNLLDEIEIPKENIYKIEILKTPLDSKQDYEKKLMKYFHRNIDFDLIYLGLGTDGHTGSIFEIDDAMCDELVLITENERHKHKRITLGMNTINSAKKKVFLLTKEKGEILKNLREFSYPASLVEDAIYIIEKS